MRATSLVLLSSTLASASIWNGWRDQYVRVSPQIAEGIGKARRRLQAEGKDFPEELKLAAVKAMQAAERVSHASRFGGPEVGTRRQMMVVENDGTTRVSVVNGVTIPDMSLFDCPWASRLHPWGQAQLDVDPDNFTVDGGLCLPYQEIPFPYSIGINPVDPVAAGIVAPGPNFNPVDANNSNLPTCRDDTGNIVWCKYPGETEATQLGENYGHAAANAGWVDLAGNAVSDADQLSTPICTKTYVNDCKFSTKKTRRYKYEDGAAIAPGAVANEGYDINWVLTRVAQVRNSLPGIAARMEEDLGLSPGTLGTMPFPQDMYTTLYGLPTGTLPGTSGTYPHAYTKGEYTADAIPAIDASKDGECSTRDSMAQVIGHHGVPRSASTEYSMRDGTGQCDTDEGATAGRQMPWIVTAGLSAGCH